KEHPRSLCKSIRGRLRTLRDLIYRSLQCHLAHAVRELSHPISLEQFWFSSLSDRYQDSNHSARNHELLLSCGLQTFKNQARLAERIYCQNQKRRPLRKCLLSLGPSLLNGGFVWLPIA